MAFQTWGHCKVIVYQAKGVQLNSAFNKSRQLESTALQLVPLEAFGSNLICNPRMTLDFHPAHFLANNSPGVGCLLRSGRTGWRSTQAGRP